MFYYKRKYSVDKENPRIATKVSYADCIDDYYCYYYNVDGDNSSVYSTIIGNTPLPPNTVTSWSVKVLKSNYGWGIYIGVAPSDIDQDKDDNSGRCGWYFYCYQSKLCSGPPHKYNGKEYGPRKDKAG